MASGILANQFKWKRQLHERFDFDRQKYCSGGGPNQPINKNVWQFQQIHELPGYMERQERRHRKSFYTLGQFWAKYRNFGQ